MNDHHILDAVAVATPAELRKRSLPIWFKGVCWFFLVFSAYNWVAFLSGMLLGIQIPVIFLFFGVAAIPMGSIFAMALYLLIIFATVVLLTGKSWAIEACTVVAGIQALIMFGDFAIGLTKGTFHIPISLGLAVVFYLSLQNFKEGWKNPKPILEETPLISD